MLRALSFFKWSIAATVLAISAAFFYGGVHAAGVVAILIVLESSVSFDNAVVNASILRRLSQRWQEVFLTVGIVIAVFGMRVIFPIAIVAVSAGIGLLEAAQLAVFDKQTYANKVEQAAPIIGGFGGTFLLMVALGYFLDPERTVHWIAPIERALARAGRIRGLPSALAAVAIIVVSRYVSADAERDVLLAGLVGLAAYLLVRGLADLVQRRQGNEQRLTGTAGLAAFFYLEMLDASFSLDGVLGAFAITRDIVLIGLGLGVGAIYVRSLTVYLVRERALSEYPYLKSGAHWAILALAVLLYVSSEVHVLEWVTAAIGLGVIAASFASSIRSGRSHSRIEVR